MKTSLKIAALSVLALALNSTVRADNITAIFGTGNPNDGWAVNTSYGPSGTQDNGVQLGLRAKTYGGAVSTNSGFDYYVEQGFSPLNPARSTWNLEFSINSDLDGSANGLTTLVAASGNPKYRFELTLDLDSGAGVIASTVLPLSYWADNSLGNLGTANGAGVEDNTLSTHTIAQNSQNSLWLGVNPNFAGSYIYTLTAYLWDDNGTGGNPGSNMVIPSPYAKTQIRVNVVPDGGTTALLLGLGLMAMAAGRRYLGKR